MVCDRWVNSKFNIYIIYTWSSCVHSCSRVLTLTLTVHDYCMLLYCTTVLYYCSTVLILLLLICVWSADDMMIMLAIILTFLLMIFIRILYVCLFAFWYYCTVCCMMYVLYIEYAYCVDTDTWYEYLLQRNYCVVWK